MKIRKASLDDFEKLKEIKIEFFLWECGFDKRLNPEFVKKELGKAMTKHLKERNRIFFVAEEKGKFVGYAAAKIEKNPPFVKAKLTGHLSNIYVKPDYRKSGVGKALFDKTMSWFKQKKVGEQSLLVHKENDPALSLYQKLGYKEYIVDMRK